MKDKIVTVDFRGNVIRKHRTAWAAYEYANLSHIKKAYDARALYNDQLIKKGTTADIVRGKLDINRLIAPHNHELMPDGTVKTLCVDGHWESTYKNKEGKILSYYDVLYV